VDVTRRLYVPAVGLSYPRSLSPSAVSSFKDCPLAFRFAYVDRLPEPPSPWTTKGTLVHKALELLMLRPPAERTVEAALDDLDQARAFFADDPEFTELELAPEEWEAFHADAAEHVRRYFELEDPSTITPIGLELKLEADLGEIKLRGIIDRLELDGDDLVVTDYKTGSVPSEFVENARLAGVHVYSLLCERMLGRRPARIQLLYLSKPEAIIARPSDRSTASVGRKALAVWEAVERACRFDDFRPRPSRLCDFCSFRPYCPAHGGDPARAVELRGPGTVVEPELPLAVG
jgi:putative RecB family exonuclease